MILKSVILAACLLGAYAATASACDGVQALSGVCYGQQQLLVQPQVVYAAPLVQQQVVYAQPQRQLIVERQKIVRQRAPLFQRQRVQRQKQVVIQRQQLIY